MHSEHRGDVRLLFGDPGQSTRILYRQALIAAGYSHLRDFDTLEGFADLLAVSQPDLVFMDVAMRGGDAIALVRDLRHGKLGVNPYLPVILTAWEGAAAMVRRAIDAGADDLLLKPLSTRALLERIETLAWQRKPFVVTSDYIGPDRRKAADRRESTVPLIEVPNTMRLKLSGAALDAKAMQQEIHAANRQVNEQRLRADAFRIAFVAEQILPLYKAELQPDHGTLVMLRDLIVSIEDIQRRVAHTDFAHVAELCERMLLPARQMLERGEAFEFMPDWQKTFDLMKTLGDAVLAFFHPDRDASALAREVTQAIDRFRARKAAQAAGELPLD
ncbi:MAG TPA: response regulator [Ferrovibrio sp.]|uniref:response regulator n=1 Tax=Ferrovibrio sp. TaxID=1917215 RepID=UPI002ED154FA